MLAIQNRMGTTKALVFLCGTLAFLLFTVNAGAQQSPPPPAPPASEKPAGGIKPPMAKPTPTDEQEDIDVVRVTSNLVVVPVSVTDAAGQPVLGLKPTDFRLEEEGRQQEVAQIGDPEQVPLDIAILLDVSASTDARFTFEQQAAASFLKQVLKPGDRATIFAIDEKPRFIQALSTVETASQKLMMIAPAKGFTAFFDTVIQAAQYLDKNSSPQHRRVIVVVSDGDDTARILDASGIRAATATQPNKDNKLIAQQEQFRLLRQSQLETQKEVEKAEAVFYSINPSGQTMHLNVRTARAEEGMEQLANATGGASFSPEKTEDLEAVFHRIASELRAQYLLQYYSNNESPSGKYLHIKVNLPSQPALRIRARQGYYPKHK